MNKTDAAKFLNIGVRSLERYTSQGRIATGQKRGKTGMVVDYAEGDLAKLKAELEGEEDSGEDTPNPATSPKVASPATALARLPFQSPQQLARIYGEGAPASPTPAKESPDTRQVAPKLLWTLDEAALMTGISKQRLRAAIEEGELKAGRVGRAFRLRPDDVREWVNGLF